MGASFASLAGVGKGHLAGGIIAYVYLTG
jgi:hypothetical protein